MERFVSTHRVRRRAGIISLLLSLFSGILLASRETLALPPEESNAFLAASGHLELPQQIIAQLRETVANEPCRDVVSSKRIEVVGTVVSTYSFSSGDTGRRNFLVIIDGKNSDSPATWIVEIPPSSLGKKLEKPKLGATLKIIGIPRVIRKSTVGPIQQKVFEGTATSEEEELIETFSLLTSILWQVGEAPFGSEPAVVCYIILNHSVLFSQ